MLGAVAKAESMLLSMLGQRQGVSKALSELNRFSAVARLMDQEVLGGSIIPC